MSKKPLTIGDKFISQVTLGGYVKDQVYTVTSVEPTHGNITGDDIGYWLMANQIKRQFNESKIDLELAHSRLTAELDAVSSKLAFLKLTDSDVFDEVEYTVYQALNVLDVTEDRFKRMKLLAKLFKDIT